MIRRCSFLVVVPTLIKQRWNNFHRVTLFQSLWLGICWTLIIDWKLKLSQHICLYLVTKEIQWSCEYFGSSDLIVTLDALKTSVYCFCSNIWSLRWVVVFPSKHINFQSLSKQLWLSTFISVVSKLIFGWNLRSSQMMLFQRWQATIFDALIFNGQWMNNKTV